MCYGYGFIDAYMQDWLANQGEFYRMLRDGEEPTEEAREEQCSVEVQKDKMKRLIADEEDWEYQPIPEEILKINAVGAWIGPTPASVQRIIEVLDMCKHYVEELGEMPYSKKPVGVEDDRVDHIIRELNEALVDEFRAWGYNAGYHHGAFTFLDLSIEDKRTIVAELQEAMEETGIKEKLVPDSRNQFPHTTDLCTSVNSPPLTEHQQRLREEAAEGEQSATGEEL